MTEELSAMPSAALEPEPMLEGLNVLVEVAKRLAPGVAFELYHRASISVRVERSLPGGPDEVQLGRDDGLAIRVVEGADGQTVFVASSGCDESVVTWLMDRARRGYGSPGGPGWESDVTRTDHDPRADLPSPTDLRAWIDRAASRLRREGATRSRARVDAAGIVESWATSDGLNASRSRLRSWAMLERSGAGLDGAPIIVAARSWEQLDEQGWRRTADDYRWPTTDSVDEVSGKFALVFSPEAAATLVGLLVRAIHGQQASVGLQVGPGWSVSDEPLTPGGLLASTFDDIGETCSNRPLSDGKQVLSGMGGCGTWRRSSFRDAPSSRASQLVVATHEINLPARAVVVSGLKVHVLAPNSWILECQGGLLEQGAPGTRIHGLRFRVDPQNLVRECIGTWGVARESYSGVCTPALIFSDRRR